jgi:hypothetical protein
VAGTTTEVELSVEHHPPYLSVRGNMADAIDEVTGDERLVYVAYDATGQVLERFDRWVEVDSETKDYATGWFVLPNGTDDVEVSFTSDRSGHEETFTRRFEDLQPGEFREVEFDPRVANQVRLSGTYSEAGVIRPDSSFFIHVDMRDADDNPVETNDDGQTAFAVGVTTDDEGRWSLELTAPLDTDHIDLTALSGAYASRRIDAAELSTDVVWDVDVSMTALTLSGTVTVDGDPYTGWVFVNGEQLWIDPSGTTPSSIQSTGGFGLSTMATNGAYSIVKFFPADTNHVALSMYIGGRPYALHVAIHPEGDAVEWNVDVHTDTAALTVNGEFDGIGGCAVSAQLPQVLDAELWAFDGAVGIHDPETGWDGGTLVGVFEIVPYFDGSRQRWMYRIGADVPLSTQHVGIVFATDEMYDSGIGIGGAASTSVLPFGDHALYAPLVLPAPCTS